MNKNAKIYPDLPDNYPLCLHTDCPMADHCLRQLAFRRHAELGLYLRLVNPSQCTRQSGCPHYVSNRPVKFAKGFTNFKRSMYPAQYDRFMTILIAHYGRNQYFSRRRGDIVLSPEEQELIRSILVRVGVDHPMEFDQYIEAINWIP